MVPAEEFGPGGQPFRVLVAPAAELMMDFHAHLSLSEVIGVLGGSWDADTRELRCARARAAAQRGPRARTCAQGVLQPGRPGTGTGTGTGTGAGGSAHSASWRPARPPPERRVRLSGLRVGSDLRVRVGEARPSMSGARSAQGAARVPGARAGGGHGHDQRGDGPRGRVPRALGHRGGPRHAVRGPRPRRRPRAPRGCQVACSGGAGCGCPRTAGGRSGGAGGAVLACGTRPMHAGADPDVIHTLALPSFFH